MRGQSPNEVTNHERLRGFTIVELLVVIVVIAILAAITIVAFKGVRDRADASRASSTVDSYAKVLRLYFINSGSYPSSMSEPTGELCLGHASDFPAAGSFPAGTCLYNSSADSCGLPSCPGGHYVVSADDSAMGSLLASSGVTISNSSFSNAVMGSETWRGIRYSYDPSTPQYPPRLEWIVNGPQSCAPGSGSPGSWWGSTWCTLDLK